MPQHPDTNALHAVVSASPPHSDLEDVGDTAYLTQLSGADTAAWKLSRLWKQSAHAKLLRQPPPPTASADSNLAVLLTQSSLFAGVLTGLKKDAVSAILQHQDVKLAEAAQSVLKDIFASGAAATLAKLIAWLQQRPEQLHLPLLASPDTDTIEATTYSSSCLWMTCTSALARLLDAACAADACSVSIKGTRKVAEQLQQSGLPQQLPSFLWQATTNIAAAGQPLVSVPVCKLTRLLRASISVLMHPGCAEAHEIDWRWAQEGLQQLLTCAVAAGLMRRMPGGTPAGAPAGAAAALRNRAKGDSGSSSSSNARDDRTDVLAQRMCSDMLAAADCMFAQCLVDAGPRKPVHLVGFVAQPVAAEVALQLLAARCIQMQSQHMQQLQQQQQLLLLSRQLGRRVRGDLLLLPDPNQQLAQLMPGDQLLLAVEVQVNAVSSCAADVSVAAGSSASGDMQLCDAISVLHRHVAVVEHINSNSSSSSGCSSPALSAAALQLSSYLLLLAAAHWQRVYHCLPSKQKMLLAVDQAALASEEDICAAEQAHQQMANDTELLSLCAALLCAQLNALTNSRQWQPQLQLLQQQGGEVLLQGLTLAVRCGSLDGQLQQQDHMQPISLLHALASTPPGGNDKQQRAMQDLFVSQLTRKHPVAFYQFLDLCARSSQASSQQLCTYDLNQVEGIALSSSSRLGARVLTDLLKDTAAVSALGSAICSTVKLVLASTASGDASRAGVPAAACQQGAGSSSSSGQQQHTEQQQQDGQVSQILQDLSDVFGLTRRLQRFSDALLPAVKAAAAAEAVANSLLLDSSSSSYGSVSGNSTGSSSGSSTTGASSDIQQVAASVLFLLVLVCRSLVALHDTVMSWLEVATNESPTAAAAAAAATAADGARTTAAAAAATAAAAKSEAVPSDGAFGGLRAGGMLSQLFMEAVIETYVSVDATLKVCLQMQRTWRAVVLSRAAAGAAAAAAAASGEQSGQHTSSATSVCSNSLNDGACSSSSSGGSSIGSNGRDDRSSRGEPVRWQYLLRLHESRKLATAISAFDSRWRPIFMPTADPLSSSGDTSAGKWVLLDVNVTQQLKEKLLDNSAQDVAGQNAVRCRKMALLRRPYQHVVGLCRTLAAVAPLPVVCNNPGCRQLQGVSEAAAAKFVCAGCGCRYCSAGCQAAGWRFHKKACRRMAACGLQVNSK